MDTSAPKPLRVLLRQRRTGLYLQPSGEWNSNRETARVFLDSPIAYLWAKDQQLVGADILLAFADPSNDFVAMRV